MSTPPEFRPFQKIARLNREVIVTEKIDGTNAVIYIPETGDNIFAGSRSRWITPADDNFAFAAWVERNRAELIAKLGPGYHFGEWWGADIQRRYGLTEKRLSLFNVAKWSDEAARPSCCGVVPVLARGADIRATAEEALAILRAEGSRAAPGFMRPEGIVAYHSASGHLYKVTLEKDEVPKGRQESP